MRWFRRKTQEARLSWVHDGITRNYMSAYWWEPGCKCHWDAGIDSDYCDHCKARRTGVLPPAKSDGGAA